MNLDPIGGPPIGWRARIWTRPVSRPLYRWSPAPLCSFDEDARIYRRAWATLVLREVPPLHTPGTPGKIRVITT
jgi:hypothetical protein